ncbi:hypothetical protein ABZ070_35230 [Streptomyces sp. NPDC006283]|uniref:hypothetical protein n=1 Tax=Streptomyces sp. NPDC006283 TaxID=3156741 RepID=UPI0033BEA0DA
MLPYLNLALKQAARSRCRYRVGAVLVKGGRILGHACNRYRNCAKIDFKHATFHAEEAVLRRRNTPHGAIIYVARLSRAGTPMLALPCPRCQDALAAHGVAEARYTTGTGIGTLRLS